MLERFPEKINERSEEVEQVEIEAREQELRLAIKPLVESLKLKPIIKDILEKLKLQLPDYLKYHPVTHTIDVLEEAVLFAYWDKLPERKMELLAIAAAYHDSGYLEKPKKNEAIAIKTVRAAMKKYGYSAKEIKAVVGAIEDTELKKTKNGLQQISRGSTLSRYLLDADVSNFGRKDFFEKAGLVFQELQNLPEEHREELGPNESPRDKFLSRTLNLMLNHDWKTEAARTLRQHQKEQNLADFNTENMIKATT